MGLQLTPPLALQWLNDHFGARVLSRKTPTTWPAHSPDLTPMDFHLWSCVKSEVHRKKATTLSELKRIAEEAVCGITPDTCAAVIRQVEARAKLCISQKGGHVENSM